MDLVNTVIANFPEIAVAKGLKYVIISSGSRNAPLTIAFNGNMNLKCISLVDERSAGFFALGISQQNRIPTILICTSGTAVLNYAPAIAEAFYQEIPLLILTADRPKEWIDQSDGQTIRQQNIFSNYCKGSFELPSVSYNTDTKWYSERIFNEAINMAMADFAGPVHINIPLNEPLYEINTNTGKDVPKHIHIAPIISTLSEETVQELVIRFDSFSKKMVVVGQMNKNPEFQILMDFLSKLDSVVVLSERTSNIRNSANIECIDRIFWTLDKQTARAIQPELLITIGKNVVSKKIKSYLREYRPKEHWNICSSVEHIDTFQSLTRVIPVNPVIFLKQIVQNMTNVNSTYKDLINKINFRKREKHKKYLETCEFSDLKAFDTILKFLPMYSNIHLGNSTPVRYAQLFEHHDNATYNSNRGTSGIDGVISTAAGASYVNGQETIVLTGDLSFVYDSNALWNKNLPSNLKIIIINNSGGGIFRFLDGPSDTGLLEEFFETNHPVNFEFLVKAFGLDYYSCENQKELESLLPEIVKPMNKSVVLEVKTPCKKSSTILKNYFKYIK